LRGLLVRAAGGGVVDRRHHRRDNAGGELREEASESLLETTHHRFMTPEPTTTEAPAQPENITSMTASAMAGPDQPGGAADASTLELPTQEQINEARESLMADMRDAVPFNRLAIHTGFQRAIQAQVASTKPEKVGMLCTAFRNYAEAEALLRG
jgi:hypothetical protein